MNDADLRYTFTCPSCSGNFSIVLERIPPVQARFRCPHCQQPMDFPSREEARVYARLQAQTPGPSPTEPEPAPARSVAAPPPPVGEATEPGAGANQRFVVEKPGFENDVFDRRAIRNLIRTGDVSESDPVRVDDKAPIPAGQVAYLQSLFKLRATSTVTPPARCRSHTERVAFFQCQLTSRPLCEECAEEKKFGNATVRVCAHCGGTVTELVTA